MPCAASGAAMVSRCWRARISVGAISTDWPPARAASIIASMATTVFPEPTSPWISRVIRSPEARSPPISESARRWAPVSANGRDGLGLPRSLRGDDHRRRMRPPLSAALGQGELVGEQFVEGQSPAMGRLGVEILRARGRVPTLERLTPARPAVPGEPGGVLPLGQVGRAFDRHLHQTTHRARRQAGGRRIDRLLIRDLGRALDRHEVIGVGHLEPDPAIVALHLAARDPLGARRVGPLQVLAVAFEPDQIDEAGLVEGADHPRQPCPPGPPVRLDGEGEGLHRAVDRQRRLARPSLDQPGRPKEHEIPHDRTRHPLHQRRDAGPDALEGRRRREQGEEDLRSHAAYASRRIVHALKPRA